MPSCEACRRSRSLCARSRILHLEVQSRQRARARAASRQCGCVLNPPPIPLTTKEMDWVYELPYQRRPHPSYGQEVIPAYKMIRFSISIQRGCFGGCTFCSITRHEGHHPEPPRNPVLARDRKGARFRARLPASSRISAGPTAKCIGSRARVPRSRAPAPARPACFPPSARTDTDTRPSYACISARARCPASRKLLIASGVRYDLAIESPEYVKGARTAPYRRLLEDRAGALADGPLSKMMKPGVGAYLQIQGAL